MSKNDMEELQYFKLNDPKELLSYSFETVRSIPLPTDGQALLQKIYKEENSILYKILEIELLIENCNKDLKLCKNIEEKLKILKERVIKNTISRKVKAKN